MIAIDTNILCLFLYKGCSVPDDFRTGKPIPNAEDRVKALIATIEEANDKVVIPTPALAEVLVVAAPNFSPYLETLRSSSAFQISPFGEKAAVEWAIRTKMAKNQGDKKDGIAATWAKISFDRQIIAIALAENVSAICSADQDVHTHATKWGIQCIHLADIKLPSRVSQPGLPFPSDERDQNEEDSKISTKLIPIDLRGSSDGHTQSQAAAQGNYPEKEQADSEKEQVESKPLDPTKIKDKTEHSDSTTAASS
jgi:predicted nucleic acid-binding protein